MRQNPERVELRRFKEHLPYCLTLSGLGDVLNILFPEFYSGLFMLNPFRIRCKKSLNSVFFQLIIQCFSINTKLVGSLTFIEFNRFQDLDNRFIFRFFGGNF